MTQLIAIGFDDELKADEALLAASRMQQHHMLDLEDACIVRRNRDWRIRVSETRDLQTGGAALRGGFSGLLVGTLSSHRSSVPSPARASAR